jgi:homoserine dehydrogenase
MWLDCDDAELNGRHGGAQTWRPNDLDAFAEHMRNSGRHALLIDCSANDDIVSRYPAGSNPACMW